MIRINEKNVSKFFPIVIIMFSFLRTEGQQIFHKGYRTGGVGTGRDVEVMNNGYLAIGTNFLVKTDFNGNQIWHKTFNKSQFTSQFFKNVKLMIETNGDTSIILSGSGKYQGIPYNPYLLKLDTQGNIIWDYSYINYSTTSYGYLTDGLFINNDTIYLIGHELSINIDSAAMFLFCIDKYGEYLWGKKYGLPYISAGQGIIKSMDGNFLIAGNIDKNSNNTRRGLLLKTDLTGEPIFAYTYGGNLNDALSDLIEYDNGDIILVGTTESFNSINPSPLIIKTDSIGNLKWCKVYDYNVYGSTIAKFSDKLIINAHPFPNIIIADTSGNIEKSFYTGGFVSYGMPYSRATPDNGFISVASMDMAGQKYLYLFKSDSLGGTGCYSYPYNITEISWQPIVESTIITFDTISMSKDSGFIILNYPLQNYTLCSTATELEETEILNHEWNLFPLPASQFIIIRSNHLLTRKFYYNVYDTTTKEIVSNYTELGKKQLKLDLENFKPGLYVIQFTDVSDNSRKLFKFVKTD